jgi:hypothetical protein
MSVKALYERREDPRVHDTIALRLSDAVSESVVRTTTCACMDDERICILNNERDEDRETRRRRGKEREGACQSSEQNGNRKRWKGRAGGVKQTTSVPEGVMQLCAVT